MIERDIRSYITIKYMNEMRETKIKSKLCDVIYGRSLSNN